MQITMCQKTFRCLQTVRNHIGCFAEEWDRTLLFSNETLQNIFLENFEGYLYVCVVYTTQKKFCSVVEKPCTADFILKVYNIHIDLWI